jgi:hypothetical protein
MTPKHKKVKPASKIGKTTPAKIKLTKAVSDATSKTKPAVPKTAVKNPMTHYAKGK